MLLPFTNEYPERAPLVAAGASGTPADFPATSSLVP